MSFAERSESRTSFRRRISTNDRLERNGSRASFRGRVSAPGKLKTLCKKFQIYPKNKHRQLGLLWLFQLRLSPLEEHGIQRRITCLLASATPSDWAISVASLILFTKTAEARLSFPTLSCSFSLAFLWSFLKPHSGSTRPRGQSRSGRSLRSSRVADSRKSCSCSTSAFTTTSLSAMPSSSSLQVLTGLCPGLAAIIGGTQTHVHRLLHLVL
jgi:hypothetical protein